MSATERPWAVSRVPTGKTLFCCDTEEYLVVSVAERDDGDQPIVAHPRGYPDAALICKAVNAHNELLEACEQRLSEWHANSRNMMRAEPASVSLARAAIAKAGDK